ncbi:MAG: SBBP repeat-containing protein, partial [Bacteroidetes bacterium]|nr:SBBP repeat-containing protein [Bacteroidota bacterium]
EVYPGIDWVWYSHPQKGYKYDFVVHPGADYQQIKLLYKSKTPIKINPQGELELYTQYGNIKEKTPVSFYEGKEVETKFKYNEQKPITINGDNGYETSISFHFPQTSNQPTPFGRVGVGQTSNLVIDPQLIWGTFYGGNGLDGPMSVDTDNNGNVFVAGYTTAPNFPVQSGGTFFQGNNAGGYDAFILKFDNVGVPLWATYYGGNSGSDVSYSIITDNSGNVFVTGYTGSSDFPVQNASTFYQGTTNGGGYDAFILKFSNAGTRLWATFYGGAGYDFSSSIVTDNIGNVFVMGYTDSPDFPLLNPGGSAFYQGANGGAEDIFILKFDNLGNRLWATYYGGSGSDRGYAITTDNSGNAYITGRTNSTNFPVLNPGGSTFYQGTNGGGEDVFMLKFDNLGNRLWATYYGGSGDDSGYSLAIDNSGNTFVIGKTNSTNFPLLNPGGSTFYQGTNGGGEDAFMLKFNNLDTCLWATYYGGSGNDYYTFGGSYDNMVTYDNLAIDSCGNVYVSFETNTNSFPYLQNSCDAGYYDNTYNGGTHDILLSLFTNTGSLTWCTYLGGNGDERRSPLAVDANNNLFVSGEWTTVSNSATYPVTDLGGGAYYDPTFNGGSDDGSMMKFCSNACICSSSVGCDPCPPTGSSTSPSICLGDSLYAGGAWQTAAGTYYDTLVNSCGSDSIITTNLTINPTPTGTDVQTACNSFTWIDGNTYTVSTNIPKDTLSAANGCDSIVTLNLTINTFVSGTDVITSCTPIVWIDGNTYSASTNTPSDTIIGGSVNGCDSVVTLNLTINTLVTNTDVQTACNSYTWIDGNTYSVSTNTPTFTIVSGASNGCDSVITLNLTINAATTFTQTFVECQGFSITVGSNVYNTSGIFTDTLTTSTGCDSIITTNLTITASITTTNIFNKCEGFSVTVGTNTYTTTGMFIDIINNCDTVVTDLTISNADSCKQSIFIPNVFSPNGDNQNDVFIALLVGLELESLKIYNRWGILLFETEDVNEGWNGKTTSGNDVSDGTYFFILNYINNEEKQVETGTLMLLR